LKYTKIDKIYLQYNNGEDNDSYSISKLQNHTFKKYDLKTGTIIKRR